MGWAAHYIEKLKQGETVVFRPRGNSMVPRIMSGQECTVSPIGDRVLEKGDVVLCKVGGSEYLHLVSAIKDGRYQISNNKKHVNGWVGPNHVYGVLISVAP